MIWVAVASAAGVLVAGIDVAVGALGSVVAVGSGDGVGVMVTSANCCDDMVEVGWKTKVGAGVGVPAGKKPKPLSISALMSSSETVIPISAAFSAITASLIILSSTSLPNWT